MNIKKLLRSLLGRNNGSAFKRWEESRDKPCDDGTRLARAEASSVKVTNLIRDYTERSDSMVYGSRVEMINRGAMLREAENLRNLDLEGRYHHLVIQAQEAAGEKYGNPNLGEPERA